ncbi:unnamed protein product [Rotaria sp. Silwood2]
MKQYFLIIIIGITTLLSSVHCAPEDNCTKLSNTDCQTCLSEPKCAYCNFRIWIIIVAVVVGVVLLAIIIAVCCVCRKCKHHSIRKEERRQQTEDQRIGERMEERRAAAEAR